MLVAELTVNKACVPLKTTESAPVKFAPRIVTESPGATPWGDIEIAVGAG